MRNLEPIFTLFCFRAKHIRPSCAALCFYHKNKIRRVSKTSCREAANLAVSPDLADYIRQLYSGFSAQRIHYELKEKFWKKNVFKIVGRLFGLYSHPFTTEFSFLPYFLKMLITCLRVLLDFYPHLKDIFGANDGVLDSFNFQIKALPTG
jgi:hypothetical protein